MEKVSIFLHKNILVSYNIKTIYMSEIKFNYREQDSKLKTDIIGHEVEVMNDFDSCKNDIS